MQPILFLKSIANQSGYYLSGNPPRWHKVARDEKTNHGARTLITDKHQIKAIESLKDRHHEGGFTKEQMKGEVRDLAGYYKHSDGLAHQHYAKTYSTYAGKISDTDTGGVDMSKAEYDDDVYLENITAEKEGKWCHAGFGTRGDIAIILNNSALPKAYRVTLDAFVTELGPGVFKVIPATNALKEKYKDIVAKGKKPRPPRVRKPYF